MDRLKQSAASFLAARRAAQATGKYHPKRRTEFMHTGGKVGKSGTKIYLDSFDGLRVIDIADAVRSEGMRPDTTGYYADSQCDNVVEPVVIRLPHGRICAGYRYTEWDGVTIDTDITDDMRTAIRWAHQMAERHAEECREDDAKNCAEQQTEELRESITQARHDCLALLREMRPLRRAGNGSPAICSALRGQVAEYLQTIKKARARIEELADNYWLAVQQ